ncbi:uncharacterized protein LOC144630152 isoform X3 [Oculina patagonica]
MLLLANAFAFFSLQLCLVLGKDLLLPKCVKIVSINTPLDDPTRAAENYGVQADRKKAVLTDKPEVFRIHKGLMEENGTVSLEAFFHPRFFLRHKNYHFHLEKEVNSSMFYKDATFFILKVTEDPALYAFELYSHPTWFMRHLSHKPYKMVLRKVNESSKHVMDSTFYLAPHRCSAKSTNKNENNAEKKTVMVGEGTFIDTADEEADIANAKANDLHVDEKGESIRIHTEDDPKDDRKPIKIHTEASTGESQADILKEVEDAFRIAQNTDNSTYLEKIEKDIEDKVNTIAEAAANEPKKPPSGTGKGNDNKINTVDDIEIHTEADEPVKAKSNFKTKIHTESDIQDVGNEEDPTNKPPKVRHEERTQRVEVLGPVIELKKPADENEQTEINKEIVVTGKPKLNGKVTIDTTFQYKHPHKAKIKKNGEHREKLNGFSIDNVVPAKRPTNTASDDMRLKTKTHARQHKAYHDYSVAHKVLNSNIEKLRNVLNAIEGAPANNKASEQGIEVVKKKSGRLGALSGQKQHLNEIEASLQLSGTPQVIPPYLPQDLAGYKVLKTQSRTQTNITKLPGPPVTQQPANNIVSANTSPVQNSAVTANPLQNASEKQVRLPQTSGTPVRANAGLPQASAPGLHVVQGNGNLPKDNVKTETSADVLDHLASELVDHDAASRPAHNVVGNSVSNWVNQPNPRNDTLQETFKELSPDDSAKIFYLGECEDKFPKACEDWAAQRYCLTFSELMKRYCRKACKLCNHVLATGFTSCDKSCGGGVRLRMIKVNNRQVLQRRSCNVQSCPINGGYTPYSNWSECSVTCGEGVRYRHRSCSNPKPQFGGRDCTRYGAPVDTMPCVKGCKGFKPGKHHSSANVGYKNGKHYSDSNLNPEEFPEYKAEESNPKNPEPVGESDSDMENQEDEESGSANQPSGYGQEFEWPKKHQRRKPLVLNHVHKNVYKHKDNHGNEHYLHIDEEQNPEDQLQTHVVRYQGHQVARMQCGPSRLLQYQKNPANNPTAFKRSNPYKMYDAGEIVYDKDGVPADTTKNVVQAFDSPYKIILQRNKNNEMKVLEQCIESDASVNPENDLKYGSQNFVDSTSLPSEQRSLPATTRPPVDGETSNRFTDNGLYEYKYQDIGQGVDEKALDSDVTAQLSRVINNEAAEISQKSLRSQDAKPTLKEELAAEKEEAWREKKYEDYVARRSKMSAGR